MTDHPLTGSPEERLAALGLVLPPTPRPVARYQSQMAAGSVVVTSGVLPMQDGRVVTGRLGESMTVEAGVAAARQAALLALSSLAAGSGGLEKIASLLSLTVYIRCAVDFARQPEVADGASELLLQVLGDAGRHARAAVGVAELPLEACLELQLMGVRRG